MYVTAGPTRDAWWGPLFRSAHERESRYLVGTTIDYVATYNIIVGSQRVPFKSNGRKKTQKTVMIAPRPPTPPYSTGT